MGDPLESLVAKDQVIDCINRLFISTDNRDWPGVLASLAPTVELDMTSLAGGAAATLAAEDIAAGWEQGLRPIQSVHHQAGNYRVEIRGEEAVAFCYAVATHYRPTESGRNTRTFVGSYDIRLTRLAGRWRIAAFRFNLKYIDGNRELESAE